MPEQLKIIIDAEVNKAIAGVQNLSKALTSDFIKATDSASVAASNLSKDVANSVQKINASLSKKIKAPDLDTSGLLASIKLLDSELTKASSTSQFQGIGGQLNKLKEDFDRLRGFKIDIDLDVSKATNEIRELSALIANTHYNLELTGGAEKDTKKLFKVLSEIGDLSGRLQEVNSIIKDLSNGIRLPKHEGMSEADIQGLVNRLKEEQAALIKSSAAIKERANAILSLPSVKKIADQQKDFTLPLIVSADLRNLRNQINEFSEERIKLNIDTSNFGVLKFDTSKALAGVKEVKSELASITTKPLNIDTTGIKNAAKVVSSDFVKATETAAIAGFNLSERVAAATTRINASIDKMVDDALRGAGLLKSSFGDFGSISLDSTQVTAAIEQLKARLATLQAQVPIIVSGVGLEKILSSIGLVKSELDSLSSKQLLVTANTSEATDRIKLLESQLLKLQSISISPEVSLDAKAQIDSLIADIRVKLDSIKANVELSADPAVINNLVDDFKAKVSGLQANILIKSEGLEKLNADIAKTKADLNSLIGKNIKVDVDATAALQKVGTLKAQLATISNVPFKFNTQAAVQSLSNLQNQVRRLDQSLKTVGGLNSFQSALGKSTQAIKTLQSTESGLNRFYNNFNAANLKAAASLGRLPQSTNAASFAMLNFGRVIQDAPFGILGIANNLNPLIESLGRASEAAKATGTSLGKNLLGALKGAGGIGIAVSVISSLLLVFRDRLFGAGKSVDEVKESFPPFITVIDRLQGRIHEFAESVGKDAAHISILSSAIESGVLPLELRAKAIEKVLSIYPGYLSTLEKEKLSYDSISKSITDSIDSLGRATEVKALLPDFEALFQKAIKAQVELQRLRRLNAPVAPGVENIFAFDEEEFRQEEKRLTDIIRGVTNEIAVAKKSLATLAGGETNLIKILFGDSLTTEPKALKNTTDDILARARLFVKDFGDTFVVPDLTETFFRTTKDLLPAAKKLLDDISKGNLQIKIPVQTDFELLPITEGISQSTIDGFFKGLKAQANIPVEVTPDLTLAKGSLDKIDQKLNLRQQFSILGDFGLKEFNKIDFSNINAGIAEATKRLQGMMDIANTLNQAIGQGLSNAFNSVFDAVLEGKSVFKALANAIKELIVSTIKAIAQMLILKAITNLIFPGGGGAIGSIARGQFTLAANPGAGGFGFGGIGSSAFNNVLTINVNGQISGDTIRLAGQRAADSSGRFG